ncbi:MAG: SRPBCC domain-containing protein [Acidobacteria bacterium]|nr:SRPBCC domain-containing protein [Acidobacteriota bacterium]MBV9475947.1 SRPBCC domain-containing protein [Acidobacteriota bacterium]
MAVISERSNAATMEGTRDIVASRVFDAPRELVFRMWIEPEHIAQWWGPRGFTNTIHSMDVRPGGEWNFIMHGPDGSDYKNKIVYGAIEPPSRLTYRHVTGPVFDVEVTFDDRDDKTEVSVRMTFESAEVRDRTANEFGAVEGLQQTLERLEERVTQESMQPFVISRTFDAPRELVYRTWTDSEHLAKWWGPKGATIVQLDNDLQRGGVMHYGMRMPDGLEIWGKWVYREITPPRRLVFVSSFSDPERGVTRHPLAGEWPLETLTTLDFEEDGGKTTVTVTWVPIRATETERKAFDGNRASMTNGWSGTFEQYGNYLGSVQS